MRPTLSFDDQQVEDGKPSHEKGQQFNDEDHVMQDETKTHTSHILTSDESSILLFDLVAHFECNDDSSYQTIIQWVVQGKVIEA